MLEQETDHRRQTHVQNGLQYRPFREVGSRALVCLHGFCHVVRLDRRYEGNLARARVI